MDPLEQELRKTKQKIKNKLSGKPLKFKAILGRADGTVKADGFNVYVTLYNGDVFEVYNERVSTSKVFKKIIVGYETPDSTFLQVLGFDDVYPSQPDAAIPNHKEGHAWFGVDPVDVYGEQILPLLPRAAGGMVVRVYAGHYVANGIRHWLPTTDVDLSGEAVAVDAEWVNAEVDEFGVITFTHGSPKANKYLLVDEDIPDPDPAKYFLFSAKMYLGLISFVQLPTETDIYDPRFTGYSSTAGGGAPAWGDITGTLSDQTDLQTALDAKEDEANKATDFSVINNTLYPTTQAVQNAINAAVAGLLDFRGDYDASVNAYPSSGGSGTAGAILKGDAWIVSVAGTLPTGQVVEIGDFLLAEIDTPGNTQANWSIIQNNIGFTPENVANKDNDPTLAADSATKYPTQQAVKAYVDAIVSGIPADLSALLFGHGTDGAVDFDGVNTFPAFASLGGSTYTLTRNVFASSMDIQAGIIVKGAGYGVFVNGILTIDGSLNANGNNGGAVVGGASMGNIAANGIRYNQGPNQGGGHGGSGAGGAGTGSTTLAAGGAGGAGGSSTNSNPVGSGGVVGLGATSSLKNMNTLTISDLLRGSIYGYTGSAAGVIAWFGGAGGGGGSGGVAGAGLGGGGSGGGHLPVFAKHIVITGTGNLSVDGGNGFDGSGSGTIGGGGGGGGGGGLLPYIYETLSNAGNISANGGTPGTCYGWRHLPVLRGTANLSTVASSYSTGASGTLIAGALILVAVHSQKGTTPDIPTLSGTNGLNTTWTQVQTTTYGATGLGRLTIFRGLASSTTSGQVTASFGGVNQTGCQIQVVQLQNVNTTTDEGLVQNPAIGVGTTGNGNISLNPFASIKNFTIGFFVDKTTAANVVPGTNYTELSELNVSTTGTLYCQYLVYDNTTFNVTNTSGHWAMWAAEIAGNDTDDSVAGSVGTIIAIQV